RAGGHYSLRNFAVAGISKSSQTGDDMENTDRFDSRRAERDFDQLRTHLHHAETNASGDVDRWLCRWLPAAPFECRRRYVGAREAMSIAWPSDYGFNGDRCLAPARCRCWRGSGADG